METTVRTKRCPHCDGLGRVPEDPAVSQDQLRHQLRDQLASGPGRAAFDARVERATADRTGP